MLSKPIQSLFNPKHLKCLTTQVSAGSCHRRFHTSRHDRQSAGLDFSLTEDQQSIRDMARKFAREEIAPKAAEYDKNGTYPRDLIVKAHELGIMTMHLPESVGGQGMGLLDSCESFFTDPSDTCD